MTPSYSIIELLKGVHHMLNEILGNTIRKYRLSQNWTQEKLGEVLSVSHQVISKWENGITTPDIQMLYAISQLFCVSIDELCGLKSNENTTVMDKVCEAAPYKERAAYDTLHENWEYIQSQITLYPSNEELLVYALRYLRLMHDRIETDEQKQETNLNILKIAGRILDFSRNDEHRSLANYNLAVYHSEQVNSLRANEEDKRNARKAKEYADLVLYKDMSKTLYRSLGAVSMEERCIAEEQTLLECLESTQRAVQNLLRRYDLVKKTSSDFKQEKQDIVKEVSEWSEQMSMRLNKVF